MTYQPQPGDIGLTSISGRVGLGIRIGQWLNGDGWHDYQHAFVVTGVRADGRREIVEAMPDGARMRLVWPRMRLVWQQPSVRDVVYLRCPDRYRDAVAAAALALIGTPYSFADYLSLALRRLRIPAPGLRAYLKSSRSMICSQLADHAAQMGGWHLFDDGRWPGDVTPGDLYQLYRQQAETIDEVAE